VIGLSELKSPVDYGKFFDQVINLDRNVRFAAIYDGHLNAKFRSGIEGYFKEEEIKSSMSEALDRWASRKKLSFKIGEPKFAMAKYGKVNRITLPLGNDGIILVTTELDIDVNKLTDEIIEIRTSLFN